MQLGIAPINWSNDDDPRLNAGISFSQCVEEMASCGYQGTEIGHLFPSNPSQLLAAIKPLGLQVVSGWYSAHLMQAQRLHSTMSGFLEYLSFLELVGAKFINVAECGQAVYKTKQALFKRQRQSLTAKQWQGLIQGLHTLGRMAADFGISLVYHHHLGTVVESLDDIDFLMQHTCPDWVSLLLDTGHAYAAGIEPSLLLQRYSNRVAYIHLKDVRQEKFLSLKNSNSSFLESITQGLFTVPGDGVINFSNFFKELHGMHYKGWLMVEAEQDPKRAHPKTFAQQAIAYIQKELTLCHDYA